MRISRAVLLLVAALAAPSAGGATGRIAPPVQGRPFTGGDAFGVGLGADAGPRLAGSSVVWAEQRAVTGAKPYPYAPIDIWLAARGGKARAVRTLVAGDKHPRLELAASQSLVGVAWSLHACLPTGRHTCTGHTYHQEVSVTRRDGRSEQLLLCKGDFRPGAPRIAVDGKTVAYTLGTCPPAAEEQEIVEIRDLAAGTTIMLRQPAGWEVRGIRVRGRYVAWALSGWDAERGRAHDELVVFDRLRRDELYRIDEAFGRVLSVAAFDVQADGKAVVASGAWPHRREARCGGPFDVAWFSTKEQFAHLLPRCASSSAELRFARDTIVFEQSTSFQRPVRLVSSDLRGKSSPVARLLGRVGDFDFDGRRIVFAQLDCFRGRIFDVRAARRRFRAPTPPSGCPVEVRRRSVTPSPNGWVVVPLRCPKGCMGAVDLLGDGSGEREIGLAAAPGNVAVRYRLGPSAMTTLRRRGRLKLRGWARTDDPRRVSSFYDLPITLRRPGVRR